MFLLIFDDFVQKMDYLKKELIFLHSVKGIIFPGTGLTILKDEDIIWTPFGP